MDPDVRLEVTEDAPLANLLADPRLMALSDDQVAALGRFGAQLAANVAALVTAFSAALAPLATAMTAALAGAAPLADRPGPRLAWGDPCGDPPVRVRRG